MRHLHNIFPIMAFAILMQFSCIAYADSGLRQNQASSFKWIRPVQGQILKPYSVWLLTA